MRAQDYRILGILDVGTTVSAHYPTPEDEPNELELADGDGDSPTWLPATGLIVRSPGSRLPLASYVNVGASALITDQRVAVACSTFVKGGGAIPLGGLASGVAALTINAVTRTAAKRQRAGRMLAGHVLYPWLISVGFTQKKDVRVDEKVRLAIADPTGQHPALMLDVVFSAKGVSASEVARWIACLAAEHLLSRDDLPHTKGAPGWKRC